ncbi:uncharacterized protein AMSG_02689 [Thecamonas trahens ATCC 50062]|uniref:C2 domain-containing protein n=1 Tax=Thecamonas trahens ATCC 50062 TaxID=461836 RepID=A0A0L0D4K8_THETB|nr:hypothetical protein AMSG_02689 [Thecamonas trahens ATCC 50062]KNC46238.1 hypothetical protein AMSG_02689 [Thecamonas trahens ATCC 50062]|eukprot:XP_013760535.1 hypothetical protein AMSG_02689 [Thecamonas trahens ATCC 50062]
MLDESSSRESLVAGGVLARVNARLTKAGATVTALALSRGHALVATLAGVVLGWGDGWHGQLGAGVLEARTTPRAVAGLPQPVDIEELAVSDSHSLARNADGAVYAWGEARDGQLGFSGKLVASATRVEALAQIRATSIVAGNGFSAVLAADGAVFVLGAAMAKRAGSTLLDAPYRVVLGSETPEFVAMAASDRALVLGTSNAEIVILSAHAGMTRLHLAALGTLVAVTASCNHFAAVVAHPVVAETLRRRAAGENGAPVLPPPRPLPKRRLVYMRGLDASMVSPIQIRASHLSSMTSQSSSAACDDVWEVGVFSSSSDDDSTDDGIDSCQASPQYPEEVLMLSSPAAAASAVSNSSVLSNSVTLSATFSHPDNSVMATQAEVRSATPVDVHLVAWFVRQMKAAEGAAAVAGLTPRRKSRARPGSQRLALAALADGAVLAGVYCSTFPAYARGLRLALDTPKVPRRGQRAVASLHNLSLLLGSVNARLEARGVTVKRPLATVTPAALAEPGQEVIRHVAGLVLVAITACASPPAPLEDVVSEVERAALRKVVRHYGGRSVAEVAVPKMAAVENELESIGEETKVARQRGLRLQVTLLNVKRALAEMQLSPENAPAEYAVIEYDGVAFSTVARPIEPVVSYNEAFELEIRRDVLAALWAGASGVAGSALRVSLVRRSEGGGEVSASGRIGLVHVVAAGGRVCTRWHTLGASGVQIQLRAYVASGEGVEVPVDKIAPSFVVSPRLARVDLDELTRDVAAWSGRGVWPEVFATSPAVPGSTMFPCGDGDGDVFKVGLVAAARARDDLLAAVLGDEHAVLSLADGYRFHVIDDAGMVWLTALDGSVCVSLRWYGDGNVKRAVADGRHVMREAVANGGQAVHVALVVGDEIRTQSLHFPGDAVLTIRIVGIPNTPRARPSANSTDLDEWRVFLGALGRGRMARIADWSGFSDSSKVELAKALDLVVEASGACPHRARAVGHVAYSTPSR